jgi:hypothetical protein
VREAHEVHAVPAVVIEFDEGATVISFDDCADRSGRPSSGLCEQLDNVEHAVSSGRHHERL